MPGKARTHDGDSVDSLCWRYYGRTADVVEAVLEANPGLAARGPILPQGLLVLMPNLPKPATRPLIQLWD
ncbi:tail protein X [Comamonas resistens]|uniref:tail protein X n=1 Tax=Comamonas resistens TaxID=3046670 RepID=UPI0039BCFEEB